jgi:hypothetical protein
MHNPRIRYITSDTLGKLSTVRLLQDMRLVTKVFYCPAYFMYLSDKSKCIILKEMIYTHSSAGGEKISVVLLDSAPVPEAQGVAVGGSARMSWWSDVQSGLLGHGYNPEHHFTPLYDLTHAGHLRYRTSTERGGEDL